MKPVAKVASAEPSIAGAIYLAELGLAGNRFYRVEWVGERCPVDDMLFIDQGPSIQSDDISYLGIQLLKSIHVVADTNRSLWSVPRFTNEIQ